jgi:hypothetical protein
MQMHCEDITIGLPLIFIVSSTHSSTFQVKKNGEIYIKFTNIINYSNYNTNSKDNDLALLKLSTSLSFSSTVTIAYLSLGINDKTLYS